MIKEVNVNNDNPFAKRIEYIYEDTSIAYLDYSLIYDRIEIDDLFVNEDYRNKKIGTKLMSYLISIAIEEKVQNITLEVKMTNTVAIKLYKNFGFLEVAIRKNYYENIDGILMEKKVM